MRERERGRKTKRDSDRQTETDRRQRGTERGTRRSLELLISPSFCSLSDSAQGVWCTQGILMSL